MATGAGKKILKLSGEVEDQTGLSWGATRRTRELLIMLINRRHDSQVGAQ